MIKYKKLAMNTVIFAVGSFGAKIFSLLLNNLYTKHISPSDLYTKSLLEILVVFLLPVFTFSLSEAIVRYGLDKQYNKKQVFTTAGLIMLCGLAVMIPIVPLLHFIPILRPITGYAILLYLLVFASALIHIQRIIHLKAWNGSQRICNINNPLGYMLHCIPFYSRRSA